jgi:tetratricopeptide (TPR) repeat protein
MNIFRILTMASLASILTAGAVHAEEDAGMPMLDQVVPVAEDPAESDINDMPPAVEDALSDEERLQAEIVRFNALRDAKTFDEAENVAKQIIEMSIRLTGPESSDTSSALTNLAIVQFETEDYEAAQQNFAAAIEIIEDTEDQLNAQLILPLRGLGAAQLASDRPDLAYRSFKRAVHISHVNEGPHNVDQIEILEALAEANLRLGNSEDARNNQDMIYALNIRHYVENSIDMVPSLERRAKWQRRTGYILDERATYRRIIRIVESENGKDDISLIEPLIKLGESYFYVNQSSPASYQPTTTGSGEMYFKRAIRIATEHPDADWTLLAKAKLKLGDYYNFRSDIGRARNTYADTWEIMSAAEDRLPYRQAALEVLTPLNSEPIPRFAGDANASDRSREDGGLREGRIVVAYDVNARGRVSDYAVVEAEPVEFENMRRHVQRAVRTRLFRPRYVAAEAVDSPNQTFTHTFYYRQEDLLLMRDETDMEDGGSEIENNEKETETS